MLAQQPNLEVVAVEPNEAMVGKFKALQPQIQIHQAAAQDLPFEDKSIDAVCAAQVHCLQADVLLQKVGTAKWGAHFLAVTLQHRLDASCPKSLQSVSRACRHSTGLRTKTPSGRSTGF